MKTHCWCGESWAVLLLAVSACFCAVVIGAEVPRDAAEEARLVTAVDALTRLKNVDLNQNPRLKETVTKLLEKTSGTPQFVRLVRHFELKDQNAGLLDAILANPRSEDSVEAIKLLVDSEDMALLRRGLEHTNTAAAVKIAEVLAGPGELKSRLLLGLVTDDNREPAVRKQAVRSLAQTEEGAHALLNLARTGHLPEALRFTASTELSRVRWSAIQSEAARILPPLQAQNDEPLPSISDLLKRTGNAANGARVFQGATAACASCHRVKGEGVDFGPDLSEIGTKLGKEALYESILDPSAGISFGYEAWQMTLKSGDEVYGLLASETAEEISIKIMGGIVLRHPKSEIRERQKMKLSIMPAGLQQGLSTQELVDLVEYLASLKKP